jgi:hypothetical protein
VITDRDSIAALFDSGCLVITIDYTNNNQVEEYAYIDPQTRSFVFNHDAYVAQMQANQWSDTGMKSVKFTIHLPFSTITVNDLVVDLHLPIIDCYDILFYIDDGIASNYRSYGFSTRFPVGSELIQATVGAMKHIKGVSGPQ